MENTDSKDYQTAMSVKLSQLMPYIDMLNEYFGLGIRYFDTTVQYQYDMNYSKGKPIPEEYDAELLLPLHVDFETVFGMLEKAGLSRDNGTHIGMMSTLALLANLIYDREYEKVIQAIWESRWDEAMRYEDVRKDLLSLYLFINDSGTFLDREITIQHATGKVRVQNSYGWFTRRMLMDYLDRYLPDITSAEQARRELDGYRKQAGRKSSDEREQVLIYGIYRMFHENTEMKADLPDRLCEFIFDYLKLIKVYDDGDVLDMSTMRPTIRYIIKKPVQPKFGLGYAMEEVNRSELSRQQDRLY